MDFSSTWVREETSTFRARGDLTDELGVLITATAFEVPTSFLLAGEAHRDGFGLVLGIDIDDELDEEDEEEKEEDDEEEEEVDWREDQRSLRRPRRRTAGLLASKFPLRERYCSTFCSLTLLTPKGARLSALLIRLLILWRSM